MKVRNAEVKRLDILGSPGVSREPKLDAAAVRSWQKKIGYFSLFAGVSTILAAQSQNVYAGESEKPVPPRIRKQAAELMRKINSGACSTPELMRRQSEYRLPGQKVQFNMVELLAGTDNCPGLAIPPGTYTTAAPYTDTGNTGGANNTVANIQAGCSEYTQTAGLDHIYSFKISARGASPQIQATTTSGTYDLSIYILNGTTGAMCPAGTDNNVTNCLAGSDGTFGGGSETITTAEMNALPLNTQLHLFVDSYYSDARGSGPYTITMRDVTVPGATPPPSTDAPLDMDADGKTDWVILRNVGGGSSGQVRWWVHTQTGTIFSADWGLASDDFISEDFDGDFKDDFAVWRSSGAQPGEQAGATQGVFYIIRSQTNTIYVDAFGQSGDDPTVVGDYTGDGQADLAVYRSGVNPGDQSVWYYRPLGSPTFTAVPWGLTGDFPAPGDYDGNNKNDFVIQRAQGAQGLFWKLMDNGATSNEVFGQANDSIVPGDYDDDTRTDIAVVRNEGGTIVWEFEPSGTAGTTVVRDFWGVAATDFTVQGDYNGDGKTDYAVWRPGNPAVFYVMSPVDRTIFSQNWGEPNDVPAANFNTH